jgi:hypothetical protein
MYLAKTHRDFQEIPKGMHPSRDHEHQIKLIPISTPPNKRPYRYTHQQKGEIDKMVQEMLDASIIRPSKSSFSSPVLLVRRKDNSWRICTNYKDLNTIIIKDKFPIPNIDGILYEHHGVTYFSKLDLKS